MVRSRAWIHRLEKKARVGTGKFRLANGEIYSYDRARASEQLWVYCISMLRAKYDLEEPAEPEILQAIKQAQNPQAAMRPFVPDVPERALINPAVLLEDDPENRPPSDPVEDLSETHEDPF